MVTKHTLPYRTCWFCLLASITLEVAGTSIMKISQSSWAIAGMLSMYVLLGFSYFFLAKAVTRIPLGVAYAFWEGLGLILIALISSLYLGERMDSTRMLALAMILAGTILIKHGTEDGQTADNTEAGNQYQLQDVEQP